MLERCLGGKGRNVKVENTQGRGRENNRRNTSDSEPEEATNKASGWNSEEFGSIDSLKYIC